jgi:LPS export ABC transporter protein LptC
VNDPQNPRKIFPKTISVDIFDQYRQPTSHIKALKAVRYENGSKVILQDSVRIWNVKNETMEGEEFVWDESNDKISSDGFVKVTTPSETIMGYGLDSNLDFTHWHLRLVTGHVQSSSMTK